MPYQINYPNGQQLNSSAQTPNGMETIFQALSIGMLGIDSIPPVNPNSAYQAVRCAFQQKGQPSWSINNTVTTISALIDTDPYGKSRDELIGPNDDISVTQYLSYTRVWRLHWDIYGPFAQSYAEALISGFAQVDWVFDWMVNGCNGMAQQPIYFVADPVAPIRAPENFQRQWWERVTLDLRFNELVIQTVTVPTGISVEITVTADTGETETFTVTAA
jgi:hypothetical protein